MPFKCIWLNSLCHFPFNFLQHMKIHVKSMITRSPITSIPCILITFALELTSIFSLLFMMLSPPLACINLFRSIHECRPRAFAIESFYNCIINLRQYTLSLLCISKFLRKLFLSFFSFHVISQKKNFYCVVHGSCLFSFHLNLTLQLNEFSVIFFTYPD